jgi:hypothetical protein
MFQPTVEGKLNGCTIRFRSRKAKNTVVGIRHDDHVAPSIRKSWHQLSRQRRSLSRYSSLADSRLRSFFIQYDFSHAERWAILVRSTKTRVYITIYVLHDNIFTSKGASRLAIWTQAAFALKWMGRYGNKTMLQRLMPKPQQPRTSQ